MVLLMQELIVATFEEKGDLRNAPIFRTSKQFFLRTYHYLFHVFILDPLNYLHTLIICVL